MYTVQALFAQAFLIPQGKGGAMQFSIPLDTDVDVYDRLHSMSPELQQIVTGLAGEAYREDEVLNYFACGRGVPGITVYMNILLQLALRYGWVNVIVDAFGQPISAAFWLGPGQTHIPLPYQVWLLVRHAWRVTGVRYLPRMLFDLAALDRAHHQAMRACGFDHCQHIYLLTIVTREDRRGEGLAARIMQPVWQRCDETGTFAYLEAAGERNAQAHYPRYGFRAFCEVPLWQLGMTYPAMVRVPQLSASASPRPPSPRLAGQLRLVE